jgi:hypothetical protein
MQMRRRAHEEARLIIVRPDFLITRRPVKSTTAFTRIGRNDPAIETK